MAERPLLAIFHEASSVITIMRDVKAGNVVTFSSESPPGKHVDEISARLEEMLSRNYEPEASRKTLEPYTTKAMASRLAVVFDSVRAGM